MKKNNVMNSASRALHKVGFKLKKHSPEILVAAGIVGTVASAVLACKATTKIHFILDEKDQKIDYLKKGVEAGEVEGYNENGEVAVIPYSEVDGKKDMAIVYAQTGLKLAKLYAPAVALGALSITGIVASHRILNKRNVALAAAYTAVDTGFKEYRNRVIERLGKEMDRELRYNLKAKEVEETVTDAKGKEKKVKKTIEVTGMQDHSIYARCFDETCAGWTRDAEYNLNFLKLQQNYANQKLQERGYLYLNEVYEMLGFQKTKAGHVVGWIYDEDNAIGDNYVDFFIYDLHDEQKRAFVNGYEKSIWIDFNVDGNVWELMQ
jgi:hypothetical protein